MNGYLFPDGFAELLIQCVAKTGEWSPDIGFPDCEGRYFILIKKNHIGFLQIYLLQRPKIMKHRFAKTNQKSPDILLFLAYPSSAMKSVINLKLFTFEALLRMSGFYSS